MSSEARPIGNRIRWFVALAAIGLLTFAVVRFEVYPRWQAEHWQQELTTTPDALDAIMVVQKMIRSDNPFADAVLRDLASDNKDIVFAAEHRVVLMFSSEAGQPFAATRWSASTLSPNLTAKYATPRIVENLPDAVTIAATNEVNDSVGLFLFTYKHNAQVYDLSEEDLATFEANGYWKEYVSRNGDPVEEKRKTWLQSEKESWQRWKERVELEFRPKASQ